MGENLLTPLPKDFKLGWKNSSKGNDWLEYVPGTETVDDWSKMLTVQIFRTLKGIEATAFTTKMDSNWTSSCPGAYSRPVRDGEENGYHFSLHIAACPKNPQTGKPEMMLMKAITGVDALYVVQYAYRAAPANELIVEASKYLRSVQVCDTRLKDRPCPVK
jgi:hypothetical protein